MNLNDPHHRSRNSHHEVSSPRTVSLIGANGMLAQMVRREAPAQWDFVLLDLPDFDLTDREQVLDALTELQPDVIINCAAYTNVDGCESEQDIAFAVNGAGPKHLAEAALACNATLVHISTDYVFSGDKSEPYTEEDAPGPKSVYGRSKLAGEKAIIESGLDRFFIVRTSWLYGPGGKNFVETVLRLAAEREELRIVADQTGSPTMTRDLARALFNLLATGRYGVYHFSDEGACSWYDFACAVLDLAKVNGMPVKAHKIHPIRTEEFPLPAPRPRYSVFSKEKYVTVTRQEIPRWQESLKDYFLLKRRDGKV
jgi:dTDP-4-dehydrorhamnose reductase